MIYLKYVPDVTVRDVTVKSVTSGTEIVTSGTIFRGKDIYSLYALILGVSLYNTEQHSNTNTARESAEFIKGH